MINYESKASLETLNAADLRASLAAYYNTRADDMEDSSEVFVFEHSSSHLKARHPGLYSSSVPFLPWYSRDAKLSVH